MLWWWRWLAVAVGDLYSNTTTVPNSAGMGDAIATTLSLVWTLMDFSSVWNSTNSASVINSRRGATVVIVFFCPLNLDLDLGLDLELKGRSDPGVCCHYRMGLRLWIRLNLLMQHLWQSRTPSLAQHCYNCCWICHLGYLLPLWSQHWPRPQNHPLTAALAWLHWDLPALDPTQHWRRQRPLLPALVPAPAQFLAPFQPQAPIMPLAWLLVCKTSEHKIYVLCTATQALQCSWKYLDIGKIAFPVNVLEL